MANRIQLRRDIASAWTAVNPILADGEMGIEKDTLRFKLGDGVSSWALLPYKGLDGADSTVPGPQGEPGPQGIQGLPGADGAQGIQGVKGDTGDAGQQGIQGVKGDTGDAGSQGIQGIPGTKGDTGDTGPQGIQGVKGDTGDQGIQGVPGSDASVTKSNVEAVLTGVISSHSHAGEIADGDKGDVVVSGDGATWLLDSRFSGGATDLAARLGCISNFASPNAGGVVTGYFYDNSFQGSASGTLAGAANRIDLAPYYTSVPLSIDQIGVAVSTGVASALAKVVIYATGSNGWPAGLLYESATLDCSATGYKFVSLSFSFSSGVQYWLGIRHSSTATLRTVAVASAVNLGLGSSSSAANYATILRRTVTFGNAAPDPWNFQSSDLVNNVTPPSVRFRAA